MSSGEVRGKLSGVSASKGGDEGKIVENGSPSWQILQMLCHSTGECFP